MKKFLLIFLFVCLPSLIFSWTGTTGSTATANEGDYDIKDIVNSSYDIGTGIIKVEITSGTIVISIEEVVATSDTITHNTLSAIQLLISTGTEISNAYLDKTYITISTATQLQNDRLERIAVVISTGLETINDTIINSSSPVDIGNFPADFPDATAQSSLSGIDTNTSNIYNQLKDSVTVSDVNYTNKVSSVTAGKTFSSGDIAFSYSMDGFSFYTEGGNATITSTFSDGTIYIREGIPVDIPLRKPIDSPILQCSLDSGTTLYYLSKGAR